MLRYHPLITAIPFRIESRPSEHLAEPGGDAFGVIRRHLGKQRAKQRIFRNVTAVENPSHVQQRGIAARPFEQRGFVQGIGYRIMKFDTPVHPAAERLVERGSASAQAEMLRGSTRILRNDDAVFIDQLDVSRDAIRAIPGHLDLRRAMGVRQAGVTRGSDADAEGA